MAGKFLSKKHNTRRKKHLIYYNLILMILFAGIVALVLFFTNKTNKRFSVKEKTNIDSYHTGTINIRLDELEKKNY